jgi:hypothetical protein
MQRRLRKERIIVGADLRLELCIKLRMRSVPISPRLNCAWVYTCGVLARKFCPGMNSANACVG